MFKRVQCPIFYVRNMSESITFYTSVGFKIERESNVYTVLRLGDSQLALNVADSPTKQPGHQVAVLVSSAVREDYERLKSFVKNISPVEDIGFGLTFVFLDLDGNKLEVVL